MPHPSVTSFRCSGNVITPLSVNYYTASNYNLSTNVSKINPSWRLFQTARREPIYLQLDIAPLNNQSVLASSDGHSGGKIIWFFMPLSNGRQYWYLADWQCEERYQGRTVRLAMETESRTMFALRTSQKTIGLYRLRIFPAREVTVDRLPERSTSVVA